MKRRSMFFSPVYPTDVLLFLKVFLLECTFSFSHLYKNRHSAIYLQSALILLQLCVVNTENYDTDNRNADCDIVFNRELFFQENSAPHN